MDCCFIAVKKRLQSFELSAALPLPYNYPSRSFAHILLTVRSHFGFSCLLLPCNLNFAAQILRPQFWILFLLPNSSAVASHNYKKSPHKLHCTNTFTNKFSFQPYSFFSHLSLPPPAPYHLTSLSSPLYLPSSACKFVSHTNVSSSSLSSSPSILSIDNPLNSKQLAIHNVFVTIMQPGFQATH